MPVDRFSGRQSPTPPTPSRRGLRWPWLALSALLAGAPSSARASACASSCSSYENVSIEVSPSLDCLSVDWVESTCTCQVSLKLTNNCEEDIELDASIDTCWDTKEDPLQPAQGREGTPLQPGSRGISLRVAFQDEPAGPQGGRPVRAAPCARARRCPVQRAAVPGRWRAGGRGPVAVRSRSECLLSSPVAPAARRTRGPRG